MATSILLLTNINHDLVIDLASSFGLIATLGTFAGLYQKTWIGLLGFGLFNIALIGLNNYFNIQKE